MTTEVSPQPDLHVVRNEEPAVTHPEPGLSRHVMAWSPSLMLVRHTMEQGWRGAAHSHPHEQVAYVVSGRIGVRVGAKTLELCAGDSFLVRSGVEHEAWALEPSVVLDAFTPMRKEYA